MYGYQYNGKGRGQILSTLLSHFKTIQVTIIYNLQIYTSFLSKHQISLI